MQSGQIRHGFFIGLLLLVTAAFVIMVRSFLQPLFWAAVLAVLFHSVQEKFRSFFRGRSSLAAGLTITVILLMVILPLFLIGMAVAREAIILYERIATGELEFLTKLIQLMQETLPTVTHRMESLGVNFGELQKRLSGFALAAGQYLAAQAVEIGQNTIRLIGLVALMAYFLFFFLRDGERFVDALIRVLPLGDTRERRLFRRFAIVSRATMKGVFVVAIVQGGFGGLLFWAVGIGAPVFWGVIMTVLSIFPVVGAFIVWAPAGVILIISGDIMRGVIVLAVGSLLIGLVDNVLRPLLVSRDTRIPDFLILLSTLGGLTVFGISGFVIGPIIAALFLSVWEMFGKEYAVEEDAKPRIIPGEPS